MLMHNESFAEQRVDNSEFFVQLADSSVKSIKPINNIFCPTVRLSLLLHYSYAMDKEFAIE
jgi:hypothetical protein